MCVAYHEEQVNESVSFPTPHSIVSEQMAMGLKEWVVVRNDATRSQLAECC